MDTAALAARAPPRETHAAKHFYSQTGIALAQPDRVDGDPVSGHEQSVAPRITAYQYARQCWERKHWGLPRDESQKRLWTLFWTNGNPHDEMPMGSWSRPPAWVEQLVRFGPPPAPPAVTHTGPPA